MSRIYSCSLVVVVASLLAAGRSDAQSPKQCPYGNSDVGTSTTFSSGTVLSNAPVTLAATVAPVGSVQAYPVDPSLVIFDVAHVNGEVVTEVNGTAGNDPYTATIAALPPDVYQVSVLFAGFDYCLSPSIGGGTLTVVPVGGPGVGAIEGKYAFSLRGVMHAPGTSASPVVAVGSITADGKGTITSGSVDENSALGVLKNQPVTGSYTLDDSGAGTLTLNTPQGSRQFDLYVPAGQEQQGGVVQSGRLVETDPGSLLTSGKLERQIPLVFGPRNLFGAFAAEASGTSSAGATVGLAGELSFDDAGLSATTTTVFDSGERIRSTAAGGYTPSTYEEGRFELTLTLPGIEKPLTFAAYLIDQNHFAFMLLDSPDGMLQLSGVAAK